MKFSVAVIAILSTINAFSANVIDIQLSEKDKNYLAPVYIKKLKKLPHGKGYTHKKVQQKVESYEFTAPVINVNGQKLEDIEFKTRGNQCLGAPRRCFAAKFDNKINVGNIKTDEFNLISLWQDEGYITSEIGYNIYKALGLFHLDREFVEVKIDGKTNGLYLLAERPNKVLKKRKEASFIGRVAYFSKLEVKKFYENRTQFKIEDFEDQFKEIMKGSKKQEDSEVYNYLSERMDIDNYFRLLAAHTLTKNGDYIDEVFFYAKDEEKKGKIYFDIMAWDLDDLFKAPHPGPWNNLFFKKKLKNSLLYSMESKLDRIINNSPNLYSRFEATLKKVIQTEYTNKFIDTQINTVKSKISPYLTKEILAQSVRDDREAPAYTRSYILNLLEQRRAELKARRMELLNKP